MSQLAVVGLGPADLDRTPRHVRELLEDPDVTVIVRTMEHPAAQTLAASRQVLSCDRLYEQYESFEELYPAIASWVLEHAAERRTVFAVPGSPLVGERTVGLLREAAGDAGISITVSPAESFIDAICAQAGLDPLFDGLRVLDGRDLPAILWLDCPTIVGHVDVPVVLADVTARLLQVLPPDTKVGLSIDAGSEDGSLVWGPLSAVRPDQAGYRTSLLLPSVSAGLRGAVEVVRRLRVECPWDREQTHHSITHNLVEEAYELADALSALGPEAPQGDVEMGVYADVEEELGDVLFQVLFHATMAEEAAAASLDTIGETLRSKLVRRHPHVFGDVAADSADQVVANWDLIKAAEKVRDSKLDGVPAGMSPLERAHKLQERAARAGFDWPASGPVVEKLDEELEELAGASTQDERLHELGDVLFTVINLARHLDVDPALALRRSTARFEHRFRTMEQLSDLDGLSLGEMDALWERAKEQDA